MPTPRNRRDVNRRGLLESAARLAVLGAAGAAAGCTQPAEPTGPRTPPQSPEGTPADGPGLTVTDFTDVEGDEGNLLVRVTVENRSGEQRSGTVVVSASAGDEETTVAERVTVAAGERTDVTVETALSYGTFSRNGSMRVSIT